MPHSKRVLILTTTFYPDPSVGSVRMTQWARCLPEFGWRPTILTRYYGHRATPELLAHHVHPQARLEYLNAPVSDDDPPRTPDRRASLSARARLMIGRSAASAMFIPDPGISFWRASRARVMRTVEDVKPDLIITTGPPHSNHDIGLFLARTTGIPWVADFRDPYIIDKRFAPRSPFRWMMPFHMNYAHRIYENASLVTHAIPLAARFWRIRSPELRKRVRILTNACAPELAAGRVEADITPGNRKSIRVIGQVGHDEALHLARAIAALVDRGMDLELRLIGPEPTTLPDIRALLADRLVTNRGVRHDLALRQVAGADLLVNYLNLERSGHYLLSSKLFEYVATGKPIIEVNPTVPDRQMLRRLPDIRVLNQPSLETLSTVIRESLENATPGLSPERKLFVREHEWRSQVRILSRWFDDITGNPHVPDTVPSRFGPLHGAAALAVAPILCAAIEQGLPGSL